MTVPPQHPEDETGRRPEDETPRSDQRTDDADPDTGSHRAERPVPRSGLSEQHSASYLAGGSEAHQSDPYTTITPATGPDDDGDRRTDERWDGQGRDDERHDDDAARRERDDDVILDGASTEPGPRKRTGSHLWGVLLTLVLIPVAWYLIADAGARLALPADGPWQSGTRNVAALIELGGGLLALAIALLAARWTSLGAIITGILVLLLGLPFVAFPSQTQEYLEPVTEWLRNLNDFGGNVAHHLESSGSTGRLVAYGVALILVGVVSHGARRQGRREARAAARLERRRAAGVS